MSTAEPAYAARRGTHRRRRWLIVLLVFAVLLGAIFVVADRIAVGVAEDRVATKLAGQRPFAGRPSVSIHGFPFLTQAIGGRYSDIELTGPGRTVAGMTAVHVDVKLDGAHIPLSAVSGGVESVPVDRVQVVASAPLTELARVSGVKGLTLTSSDHGSLLARAPVDIPGIGNVIVSASVHLTLSSDGIDAGMSGLKSSSGTLPSSVVDAARRAVRIHVALPDLGFSSAIASVKASGGDVVLSGTATHVTLH